MTRVIGLAAIVLFASSVIGVRQSADRDETAIRAIVSDQAAAWTAGDVGRYTAHLGHDVSFTNLFGMVMYGSEAFTARHAEILRTFFKGTRKQHTIRRIRFVTPDVAIVDIDNEVRGVTAMP